MTMNNVKYRATLWGSYEQNIGQQREIGKFLDFFWACRCDVTSCVATRLKFEGNFLIFHFTTNQVNQRAN